MPQRHFGVDHIGGGQQAAVDVPRPDLATRLIHVHTDAEEDRHGLHRQEALGHSKGFRLPLLRMAGAEFESTGCASALFKTFRRARLSGDCARAVALCGFRRAAARGVGEEDNRDLLALCTQMDAADHVDAMEDMLRECADRDHLKATVPCAFHSVQGNTHARDHKDDQFSDDPRKCGDDTAGKAWRVFTKNDGPIARALTCAGRLAHTLARGGEPEAYMKLKPWWSKGEEGAGRKP
eukprot:CAMPEP_0179862516 /NCGR_PEP_ID=MMETSP0982-20121206/14925_1 /TAXON_ID=483367 /ORGANISM="non described non described, Strain CCMP 2436" /LENGTH=236 /DNA_ID=CAMNT_0021750307 /DNA_START=519 /DNA_END=1227 /DNA_ORIENTATION=+